MLKFFRTGKLIIREVAIRWFQDNAPKLSAALSFYMIFSLTPLLILSIAIAGFVFGDHAAHGQIVEGIEQVIGREGATLVQTAILNASKPGSGIIATIISVATMTIGLTALFAELKDSMNIIWRVKPQGNIVKALVWERVVSFLMSLGVGVLLLVLLLANTLLTALNEFASEFLDVSISSIHTLNYTFSFLFTFLLFSMIYKVLPDTLVKWRDVFRGALVTTALFMIGNYFIGIYLARSVYSSTYGAAGSLAVMLIWVYYSSMIFFLGAEFTYVYARYFSGTFQNRLIRKIKEKFKKKK